MGRTHDVIISGFDLSNLENQLAAVTEQLDTIEGMYHKVIVAVLECDPIPACQREDDQLEPPWEVITRIREQRDKARREAEKYRNAVHNLEIQFRYVEKSALPWENNQLPQ